MEKNKVLLISFHNQKALGIRYLEKALKLSNYQVQIVFFKGFNSKTPSKATKFELNLLYETISEFNPGLIGLSVMTSLYLETVEEVNALLKSKFNIPILWGGVFPTLFPDKCLGYCDFAIRGEGEYALVELCNSLFNNSSYTQIKNLAFKSDNGIVINDIRPVCENLDAFGYPEIGGKNKIYINDDKISVGDPLLNSISFELSASRGCPFACSYCCSVNLHRLYKGKGTYVRFRSVSNVINEIKEAKSKMKNLKVIHFWDEIFSDDEDWINEFTLKYAKEINLPFEIWGHPLKVNRKLIKKLVDIGLYKVVMGIQSGSPRVRKEIFHRVETQEEIIEASKILSECRVPQVIYDFMLQHPFENNDDIKYTYDLCMELYPPFELQLHGLNFLPGTDIVEMALKENILTSDELNKIMYSSIQEQYSMYWRYTNKSTISNFWYRLIYMTQFPIVKPLIKYFSTEPHSFVHIKEALCLYKFCKILSRIRYFYKKGVLVLKSII